MAYNIRKTEHSGAKHGRGAHWGTKQEAKQGSKKLRRRNGKQEVKERLEEASGSWKDKDHPEIKGGAVKYVDNIRKEDEKRFERVTKR